MFYLRRYIANQIVDTSPLNLSTKPLVLHINSDLDLVAVNAPVSTTKTMLKCL